jgi:hypothetical protein
MMEHPAEPLPGVRLHALGVLMRPAVVPFTGVLISPIWASAAMTFSSVGDRQRAADCGGAVVALEACGG